MILRSITIRVGTVIAAMMMTIIVVLTNSPGTDLLGILPAFC